MKSLILMFILTAIFSQILSTIPTSGRFIFGFFRDSSCNTIIQTQKSASTTIKCWDLNSKLFEPTGWTSTTKELKLAYYNATNCSGNYIYEGTAVCDGTCNTFGRLGFYFSCQYTNVPTYGLFTYTGYSEGACINKSLPSITYNSTNFCWISSSTTSFFPIDWDHTNNLLTTKESISSLDCDNFVCTNTISGTLTCDGNCQFDAAILKHYKCSYNNSQNPILRITILILILVIFV